MVTNILMPTPRFNGMFELRNPVLGSQEIQELEGAYRHSLTRDNIHWLLHQYVNFTGRSSEVS